jgi:hypothetical protein
MTWRRGRVVLPGVLLALSATLTACSSDDDAPLEIDEESVDVVPSETATEPPVEEPTEPTPSPTTQTPAPADEPTATPPASDQGCDPGVFTPTARVDVRRSDTQLLGFERHRIGPGTGIRRSERVELFEALFSGILDEDGAEVTGSLRTAVVDRLGADVVRDGVEQLRVPVRLSNGSNRHRQYVVYVFATRSEGGWTATVCPDGGQDSGPSDVRGTFAAWQRLDHGVVWCDADPQNLSRTAQDAQLNGCG